MQKYIIVHPAPKVFMFGFGRSRFFLTIFHASATILLRLPAKLRTFDGRSQHTYSWFVICSRND